MRNRNKSPSYALTYSEVALAWFMFKKKSADTFEITKEFKAKGLPFVTEADVYNAISAVREQERAWE
jgi:hypothetical protein